MREVEEIKQRLHVEDVVSEYVSLDRSARAPKGLCPFHNEKTPSFVLNPAKGTWTCFGACSDSGDIFSFIMKKENMGFKQALELLAKRAGVKLRISDDGTKISSHSIWRINAVAAEWFGAMLKSGSGEPARNYLKKRGLTPQAARQRGIGFSPGATLTLYSVLKAKGVSEKALVEWGFMVKSPNGELRDLFNRRIMFEIRDANGRIIGFGGRSLEEGILPKYINSPQTPVFDKSSILYGIDWAADAIRYSKQAIIVEGYMDAVTSHEYGFSNTVAVMGVAVSSRNLKVLADMTSSGNEAGEIILCLDADVAGREASFKSLVSASTDQEISRKAVLKVAASDMGKDPDEAIRTSARAWKTSLDEAEPVFEYLIKECYRRYDLSTDQGKAQTSEDLFPVVMGAGNAYAQDTRLTRLAAVLGVSEYRLKTLYGVRSNAYSVRSYSGRRRPVRQERVERDQAISALRRSSSNPVEECLLATLIQFPRTREFGEIVPPALFMDTSNRAIFEYWKSRREKSALPKELIDLWDRLENELLPPGDDQIRIEGIRQCIQRLKENRVRSQMQLQSKVVSDEHSLANGSTLDVTLRLNEQLKEVFNSREY